MKSGAKEAGLRSVSSRLSLLMSPRHSGADVGAHDDRDGLSEFHDAGVDKAHRHDGGGGRALDDGRNAGAKRQALDGVVGQAFKCFFQVGAGKTLQGDAEQLHSVEKHAHTAKQCNDVG